MRPLRLAAPRRLLAHRRALAIGAVVVVVVAVNAAVVLVNRQPDPASIAVATPWATAQPTSSVSPSPSPSGPSPSPSASPSATPGPDPLLGTDGRLTVLLLGSDYRASNAGNRTDTIMIVSVDPTNGAVSAASIPRDTVNFPTSSTRSYSAKVNGLYQSLLSQLGRRKAGREIKRIMGDAIGVEIDSYAVIGFEGVRRLVNAVGGVDVVLSKSVSDSQYWVTSTHQGVYFPAGKNHLSGDRALIFARTRKGDNDFERARRQQLLVGAAVQAVRDRGLKHLPDLISIAGRFVHTDLPLSSAAELFAVVAKADIGSAQRVVFGPTTWATGAGGTSFSLKLKVVREWTAQWMAPVAKPAD